MKVLLYAFLRSTDRKAQIKLKLFFFFAWNLSSDFFRLKIKIELYQTYENE